MFFSFINTVDAALDLKITPDSSTRLAPGTNYNVSVSYVDGNNKGSLKSLGFNITFQNANCSIISGSCDQGNHCTFTNVSKGASLVKLSCVKGNNNESFIVSNIIGESSNGTKLNLRSASLSISTLTAATTQTELPTTTTVAPTTTTKSTKKTTKKTTTTTTTTESVTEPTTIPNQDFNEESKELKLKNLKIIGYDISFNKNRKEYTIKVRDNIKELDVIATPLSRDIVVENTGKINIADINQIEIKLSRDEEKTSYLIKIEKEHVKRVNFLLYVIVILAIFVVSGLIVMQLINRYNIKKEEIEFFKEIDDGKEDAKTLLEEEEEFTKTFFDLNKR